MKRPAPLSIEVLQSTVQRFEVKQPPTSGGYLPFLLAIFAFIQAPIVDDYSKNLAQWLAAIFLVTAFFVGRVRWKKAKCIIHATPQGLNIEVVRAGFRLPLETRSFLWQEMEEFAYDFGGDAEASLDFKWHDQPVMSFSDGDIMEFHTYLRTRFPEKEKEMSPVRIG